MKRRSRAGGEQIKGPRRKTTNPKRRNAPKAVARSNSSHDTREAEVARLARELSDERRQRTAISEVLHLLSGSHGDLSRLFDTILTNATNLCQANFGTLYLYERDAFRVVAQHNAPPAYAELRQREPLVRARRMLRMAETKQFHQEVDVRDYVASNPADKDAAAFAKVSGVRTVISVPMLRDGEVVGAIVVYRQEVRAFNDREVELLKNFAAQAVIAIENARLLNELRQSLEQQTATSQVLTIISTSQGDLQPVFEAMVDNAARICHASLGTLVLFENGGFRHVALHGAPAAYQELRAHEPVVKPYPAQALGRLASTKKVVHIPDAMAEPEPARGGLSRLAGARTLLIVPMLKDEDRSHWHLSPRG